MKTGHPPVDESNFSKIFRAGTEVSSGFSSLKTTMPDIEKKITSTWRMKNALRKHRLVVLAFLMAGVAGAQRA